MIQELINFTASLDEGFKTLGSLPKEGLHILLQIVTDDLGHAKIDTSNITYEIYSKKQNEEVSDFLNKCKFFQQNAWCINTNKCFDLPTKAIHSCSPFCVAFKREHINGGAKYKANEGKKKQIGERFEAYFNNAFELFEDKDDSKYYEIFKLFFTHKTYSIVLKNIETNLSIQRNNLETEISNLKEELKSTSDKLLKQEFKEKIANVEEKLIKVKVLDDSDYILFYLDVPSDKYIQTHNKYLKDKLFTVDKYNTEPDEQGLIYGCSNFMNGLNSSMPFLMHQTASFDISGRISNIDARLLYELQNVFANKTLPNPLPVFIYKEELQNKVIGIFKDSGFKFGYKEIVQRLIDKNEDDISNYYLLNWQNTKDGLVFLDFDFVTKFEYYISEKTLGILNLFDLKEKGGKNPKQKIILKNIFDLEQQVFKPLIQNKYHRIDYFGALNNDDYNKLDFTFISYSKYRKSIYDFIYKSQKHTIEGYSFDELVFNSIRDDIKNSNEYGVKDSLNIWYSLYEYFNPNKKINMVNKLREYQNFVTAIIAEEKLDEITDEKFAFAAGQVINYISSKSKSADTSYNYLESYLQQSKCEELKRAIANDFGRYKHENFSRNFEKVASFVLSYETTTNLKHLLPQLLSGVFSKNQLYSTNQ